MKDKITKRWALETCILMWDWLAEHPDQGKGAAIKKLGLPDDMYSDCSACEYDEQVQSAQGAGEFCTNCPVWDSDGTCAAKIGGDGGEFSAWLYASTIEDTSYWAKAIANRARRKLTQLGNEE